MINPELINDMSRYIGRTVTVFTESGGISGSGFTGVLVHVGETVKKLITDIGAAPACSLGSSCTSSYAECYGGYGYGGYGAGYGANAYRGSSLLGSIADIPINKIVSFTHDAL